MKLIPERLIIVVLMIILVISNVYAVSVSQKQILLTLGNNVAFIDGKPTTLDAPPATIKGRTMVPLRFIGEAFGAKVDWDNTTKSATLTLNEKECPPCPECPKSALHNLAYINLFDSKSTSNIRSKNFYIKNTSVSITGRYAPSVYAKSLYSASVTISLYKEDSTLVTTFEAIGEPERNKFNDCMKSGELFCDLSNLTTVSQLEPGIYYVEVKAVMENSNDYYWNAVLNENEK